MKKAILAISIFLLMLFVIPNSYAQDAHSFGVKGGATVTTLSNMGKSSIKPGLQVGGFAKLGGGESIFFKAELLATQKGAWTLGRSEVNNFNLNYLDLALMFGIELYKGLSMNVGMQPSMLVRGTHRSSGAENGDTRSIGSEIARFDYSLLIGAEYFVNPDWFIGARYSHGFVPLQNRRGEFTINNNNQLLSNRVVQFYVGYVLK
ncbi:porin family protein [Cytophagaceae bacterium ABcell3]|nr:porin family protein [Cytophagaceae bacterium ABcell3]